MSTAAGNGMILRFISIVHNLSTILFTKKQPIKVSGWRMEAVVLCQICHLLEADSECGWEINR